MFCAPQLHSYSEFFIVDYLINNLTMLFSFLDFARVLEVLHLVELHFARDVSTADPSKSLSAVYRTLSSEPTLSMYERQCLRLALQLLNAPQAIFLDEVGHLLLLFVALYFSLFLFVVMILINDISFVSFFFSLRRNSISKKQSCS